MIRAVFFDAGNTLLYAHPGVPEVCAEILDRLGTPVALDRITHAVEVAEAFYDERYSSDDTFWASEIAATDFWTSYYGKITELIDLDGASEEFAQLAYDEFGKAKRWRLYPDVLPALKSLKKRGLTLGIVSNWDVRLPEICFALGLDEVFSFIISSARVGRIKPQAEIFEMALARAGVEPEEAIHVGDHFYADVLGAQSAGIRPIMVDRRKNRRESDLDRPSDFDHVPDLSELLQLV